MTKPILFYLNIIQQIYNKIFPNIRIAVQLIILSNKHVLLVKHTYTNKYYFPGGGVKKSESLRQAIKREIIEEIGIKIHKAKLHQIIEFYKNHRQDYVFIFKTTEISQKDKISIDNIEIKKYRWFPLSSINKYKSIISTTTYRQLTKLHTNSSPPHLS